MKFSYAPTSLRTLIPDHWGDTAVGMKRGKVLHTKDHFAFHSHILACGSGALEKQGYTREVAQFIKENCRAALRLRAISIYAYESFANCSGYRTWTDIGSAAYLCLSSSISSLDAMACVLYGVLLNSTPKKPNYYPDFPSLAVELDKERPGNKVSKRIRALEGAKWMKRLRDTRKKVVHRGKWPEWKDGEGFSLSGKRALFDVHLTAHKKRVPSLNRSIVNLSNCIKSTVESVEKWERRNIAAIRKMAPYKSLHPQGLVFTFPVIGWHNGISDHFIMGESSHDGFSTAEEYISWRNRIWNQPENAIKTLSPGSYAM